MVARLDEEGIHCPIKGEISRFRYIDGEEAACELAGRYQIRLTVLNDPSELERYFESVVGAGLIKEGLYLLVYGENWTALVFNRKQAADFAAALDGEILSS